MYLDDKAIFKESLDESETMKRWRGCQSNDTMEIVLRLATRLPSEFSAGIFVCVHKGGIYILGKSTILGQFDA